MHPGEKGDVDCGQQGKNGCIPLVQETSGKGPDSNFFAAANGGGANHFPPGSNIAHKLSQLVLLNQMNMELTDETETLEAEVRCEMLELQTNLNMLSEGFWKNDHLTASMFDSLRILVAEGADVSDCFDQDLCLTLKMSLHLLHHAQGCEFISRRCDDLMRTWDWMSTPPPPHNDTCCMPPPGCTTAPITILGEEKIRHGLGSSKTQCAAAARPAAIVAAAVENVIAASPAPGRPPGVWSGSSGD
jgi:hypothetical protein